MSRIPPTSPGGVSYTPTLDPIRVAALHEANRAVPFPDGPLARSTYRAEILTTAREFEAYLRGEVTR